jgi:putative oxidoreductase
VWPDSLSLAIMKLLPDAPESRADVLKRWALRIGIGLAFFFIGKSKLDAHSEWVAIFDQIGLGQWFRYFTGAVQMVGAVMLAVPRLFVIGIILLACTMIGAIIADVFIGVPFFAMIPAAILLVLLFAGGEELIDLSSRLRLH